ncbi:MAG: hypothetical protein QXU98_01785 [Candidatus Parvarchaeota archaeon]
MRPLLKDLFNNDTDRDGRAKYDKTLMKQINGCEYGILFGNYRNKILEAFQMTLSLVR